MTRSTTLFAAPSSPLLLAFACALVGCGQPPDAVVLPDAAPPPSAVVLLDATTTPSCYADDNPTLRSLIADERAASRFEIADNLAALDAQYAQLLVAPIIAAPHAADWHEHDRGGRYLAVPLIRGERAGTLDVLLESEWSDAAGVAHAFAFTATVDYAPGTTRYDVMIEPQWRTEIVITENAQLIADRGRGCQDGLVLDLVQWPLPESDAAETAPALFCREAAGAAPGLRTEHACRRALDRAFGAAAGSALPLYMP